jgi:hypothetical protein
LLFPSTVWLSGDESSGLAHHGGDVRSDNRAGDHFGEVIVCEVALLYLRLRLLASTLICVSATACMRDAAEGWGT